LLLSSMENSKADLEDLHLNTLGLSKHALTKSLENQGLLCLKKITRKGYNE